MPRPTKTSFTIKRLALISIALVAVGFFTWYLFIRPTSHDSINLQPLPEGFASHGIDVSHHQGEIDWEDFLEKMDTTISFVYYKVTEGTHFVDSQWERNHSILSNSELKHGAYHFFTPDVSGEMQADHFLNEYTPRKSELPPVLDAEVNASTDERLIEGMKAWLKTVEGQSGIRPVIYTSYSMYRDKMKGKFDGYQFWIASYNPNASRVEDLEVIHWQYSDRGEVPGIRGLVDLNFSKEDFGPRVELAE
ncbi:MAG: GH25 family lysozyme [Crocinitomicaceae bacterium]|nr:GH25 family lysozyme [Crocinitomicaceae bacterium]